MEARRRAGRQTVTPGTSALFVMTSVAVQDAREAFDGHRAELAHTNLDNEQEARLRRVFSE